MQIGQFECVTYALPYDSRPHACRAACKVANLSVRAERGPCLLHRQGQLHVERCSLLCEGGAGIEHLLAPLVTQATLAGPEDGVGGRLCEGSTRAGRGLGG